MQTSAMRRFSALYKKEIRELRPEIIIILASAALICLAFYSWSDEQRPFLIVPLFLLMGLAAFLPFIDSFKLLTREYSSNTIYLTMSLPVRGGMILSSKYLALLSQYLLGTLMVAVSAGVVIYPYRDQIGQLLTSWLGVNEGFGGVAVVLLLLYLQNIMQLSFIIAISFLSQLIGRLTTRLPGLATFAAFLAILYLGGQTVSTLQQQFLDPITGSGNGQELGGIPGVYLQSGLGIPAEFLQQVHLYLAMNSLIYFLLALLIMLIAVYVYNHRIEL